MRNSIKSPPTVPEEGSPKTKLVSLIAVGRIGSPITVKEQEVGDEFSLQYGVHWSGRLKKGKRWVDVLVSQSRVGHIGAVSLMDDGVVTNAVWCHEVDKSRMRVDLLESIRSALISMIGQIQHSIASLDAELGQENDRDNKVSQS